MNQLGQFKKELSKLLELYMAQASYKVQDKAANYGTFAAMNMIILGLISIILVFLYASIAFFIGDQLGSYALGFLLATLILFLKTIIVFLFRRPLKQLIKKFIIALNFEEEYEGNVFERAKHFYDEKQKLQISIIKQETEVEKSLFYLWNNNQGIRSVESPDTAFGFSSSAIMEKIIHFKSMVTDAIQAFSSTKNLFKDIQALFNKADG